VVDPEFWNGGGGWKPRMWDLVSGFPSPMGTELEEGGCANFPYVKVKKKFVQYCYKNASN